MSLESFKPGDVGEAKSEKQKEESYVHRPASQAVGRVGMGAMRGEIPKVPGDTQEQIHRRELDRLKAEEALAAEGLDAESGAATEEDPTTQAQQPATEQEPKKE